MTLAFAISLIVSAGGCSFSDFWEAYRHSTASDEPERPDAASVPTNTPWAYAIPTSTPMPTATPWSYQVIPTSTPTPSPTPSPTPPPTPSPTPSPTPLPSLVGDLPTADDLPDNLMLTREDAELTADEVAAETTDPTRHLERLRTWGFRRGAAREFALDNPGVSEYFSKLLGFQASVLEFGSAQQAREALEFQRVYAKAQDDWDLDDRQVDPIGDASAALSGSARYDGVDVRVVVIFVQQDSRVYRFIAIAGLTDPFTDAARIARRFSET